MHVHVFTHIYVCGEGACGGEVNAYDYVGEKFRLLKDGGRLDKSQEVDSIKTLWDFPLWQIHYF